MLAVRGITLVSSPAIRHVAPDPFQHRPCNPSAEYGTGILLQVFFIALVTVAPKWFKIFNDFYLRNNLMMESGIIISFD